MQIFRSHYNRNIVLGAFSAPFPLSIKLWGGQIVTYKQALVGLPPSGPIGLLLNNNMVTEEERVEPWLLSLQKCKLYLIWELLLLKQEFTWL